MSPDDHNEPVIVWFPINVLEPVVAYEPVCAINESTLVSLDEVYALNEPVSSF